MAPQLSVVIPVYNEEAGLATLFARLYPALDALGIGYEVIFIDDGSRDRSAAILEEQYRARADVTRVIKPEFSPYAGRGFPTRPLFGDTHLHTAVSVDAGTLNRLGQEDALRFARGEEVVSTGGLRAKLSRPLDFLVIADHAEMYGLMPQLLSGDPEVLATEAGRRWYADFPLLATPALTK